MSNTIDHFSTDKIVCPHCGYAEEGSFEDTEGRVECYECKQPFDLTIDYSVSYTTTIPKEHPNHESHRPHPNT